MYKRQRQGLRVLAFAYKTVSDELELTLEDEYNLTFIGLIAMMDPPREESKAADVYKRQIWELM